MARTQKGWETLLVRECKYEFGRKGERECMNVSGKAKVINYFASSNHLRAYLFRLPLVNYWKHFLTFSLQRTWNAKKVFLAEKKISDFELFILSNDFLSILLPLLISFSVTIFVLGLSNFELKQLLRFGQAKFACGGQVLGSSQFSLLPQLPEKTKLASKVVKIDSKIIILRHESKSVTHSA